MLVVEKFSRRLQRVWESKLWKHNWVKGAEKGLQAASSQQNLQNKSVGREKTLLQTFLVDHVKQFLVPTFCGDVWKSWRESPNCWICTLLAWTWNLSYYLTWWKLRRVLISNGSELLRWFKTDVLGFETGTCQVSWLRNLQYQRGKKRAQRWSKIRKGNDGGKGTSSSHYLCKQHFALKFSNVEVYVNNQQSYNSNGLYAHQSYISNNFKGAISEYKRVLHCDRYDYEDFPDEIMEAPLSETFCTRRMKMLSRPDGFIMYRKLGVDFFSTSELL